MIRAEVRDKFLIRSLQTGSLLRLEAVYRETDTVFHVYETIVVSERDAALTKEAYKRFLYQDENYLKLQVAYLAEFFSVDYKGKNILEVADLITTKARKLEKEEKTLCIQ